MKDLINKNQSKWYSIFILNVHADVNFILGKEIYVNGKIFETKFWNFNQIVNQSL